jgi:hypothetical protein
MDPKTSKTIKNSRADFYAKTLLSPYWEKVKSEKKIENKKVRQLF